MDVIIRIFWVSVRKAGFKSSIEVPNEIFTHLFVGSDISSEDLINLRPVQFP